MSALRVVRRIGSGKTHVAEVRDDDLLTARFIREYWAPSFDRVACACGVNLHNKGGEVVVMTDAPVDCRPCRRLTGVSGVGPRYGGGA